MGLKNVIFSLNPKHFVKHEDHFGMEVVTHLSFAQTLWAFRG